MKAIRTTKQGNVLTISGLQGASEAELDDIAQQILNIPSINGNTKIQILTKRATELWSVSDFSSRIARRALLERL